MGGNKVTILGSRDFPNPDYVEQYVSWLPAETILLNGDARGKKPERSVDAIAKRAAEARGLAVELVPAEWDGPLGKLAGFDRNFDLVLAATGRRRRVLGRLVARIGARDRARRLPRQPPADRAAGRSVARRVPGAGARAPRLNRAAAAPVVPLEVVSAERRFQAGFAEEATDDPGLVLDDATGTVSVVEPGGTRRGISDGGTSPAEVHLSSAEILSLAASPVDAGLPFGPDILAIPTRVATLTAPGATPYANGSVVQLQVGPRLNLWYIGIARANVVTAASPQLAYCSYWDFLMGSIDEQSLTPSQFLNQPWVVTVDTDEFTDGDGTVEVRIGYYLFDFS